jgi:hypothetical protein
VLRELHAWIFAVTAAFTLRTASSVGAVDPLPEASHSLTEKLDLDYEEAYARNFGFSEKVRGTFLRSSGQMNDEKCATVVSKCTVPPAMLGCRSAASL